MKNRFNFRIWDKNNNCFSDECLLLTRKGMLKEVDFEEGTITSVNQKNYVLMQSTGLTDKNGKEIFEGDIVNIIKEFENFKDEVFYDEELCSIRLKGYSNDYCDFADWIREGFELEVIGNIYENQELLKKIKE